MFGSKKKVLETGTSAQATVINIQDTGVTINMNPRVKLTLQVQPEGQSPFQATKVATVSRLEIPSIGDRYWVRFDPGDPNKLEFDTNKASQDLQAAQATYAAAQSSRTRCSCRPTSPRAGSAAVARALRFRRRPKETW
jgi:hypothetical protein